jgi:hypothetical protein
MYHGLSVFEPWATAPGTYYWQATTTYLQNRPFPETFREVRYLSPIYTLVIAPKPPPPSPPPTPLPASTPPAATPSLTLSDAYRAVKAIIKDRTHRTAHHLSDKCRSVTGTQARCKVSWASDTRYSATTLVYAGTFDIEAAGDGEVFYSFTGLLERVGCTVHHSTKRCASKVHW